MPYPSQVSHERVIEMARQLLEAEGPEALSLHRIAQSLGVKAPSLYRYFPHKTALLQAVNAITARELTAAMMVAASVSSEVYPALLAMFAAYRAYAHAHPHTYHLLYNTPEDASKPAPELLEQLALPLQALMQEWVGPEKSLAALRGAWALVHGFSLLEAQGHFQRGGDVTAAFEASIAAYLQGWRP